MARPQGPEAGYCKASRAALLYAMVGALWILCSDTLLGLWIEDPGLLQYAQLGKELAFVLASATALLLLLRRNHQRHLAHLRQDACQRAQLRELSQFRERIIDSANVWINVLDRHGQVTVWNQAAERITGYGREEVLGHDRIWKWLYPDPVYRAEIHTRVDDMLVRAKKFNGFESRIRARDGSTKVILWNAGRFYDEQGHVNGLIAIGRDTTKHKLAEQALVEHERQLATLMANLPGMAYRCRDTTHWTMQFASQGCRRLTGYAPEDFIDSHRLTFAAIIHPEDRQTLAIEIARAQTERRPFAVEYRIRHKDGREIWVWEQGQATKVGETCLLEGIIIDISERKRMEQALAQLAARDPLTGLYNRRELEQQLQAELASAGRYQHALGLLWLDIDHFKSINDRFGHLAGDAVLRQLAELLQEQVRAADYIARYGGEELVIVLPESDAEESLRLAERLCTTVATTPLKIPERPPIRISVSIGVAAFPAHATDIDTLFKIADQAMYTAKQQGRNRVHLATLTSLHDRQSPECTA
ncbi:sensor domain-containing diguanylate cyclase [Marichromatium bheemlicum]|uniref:Diguanylate cyclase n=1 Tax=Marichromatium bheemlicum TaxID=365339 RepID=A0ABX1I7T1_9GAMM|nr:diguanylate cyclase [Marichromatium bheemlicum]NKN32292.1 diguanylate cyclase [Marichromatium bheemlicum]